MHVSRFVVALAVLAALCFVFVSAQGSAIPNGTHGFAGPFPWQLRSFSTTVSTAPATAGWSAFGPVVTIIPQVRDDGLIVTAVHVAVVDAPTAVAVTDLRLLDRGTDSARIRFASENVFEVTAAKDTVFSPGLPLQRGATLEVQVRHRRSGTTGVAQAATYRVTVTGYVW